MVVITVCAPCSRDIATGYYWLDDRGIGVRIPTRARNLFYSTASYLIATGSFLGGTTTPLHFHCPIPYVCLHDMYNWCSRCFSGYGGQHTCITYDAVNQAYIQARKRISKYTHSLTTLRTRYLGQLSSSYLRRFCRLREHQRMGKQWIVHWHVAMETDAQFMHMKDATLASKVRKC